MLELAWLQGLRACSTYLTLKKESAVFTKDH